MTARKESFVECDGCGEIHRVGAVSAFDARLASQRDGWVVRNQSMDYCPGCVEKMGLRKRSRTGEGTIWRELDRSGRLDKFFREF